MLVLHLFMFFATFACTLSAVVKPNVDRSVNKELDAKDKILTNAERLARGMIPAMPRALEKILSTKAVQNSGIVIGSINRPAVQQQAACPSSLPISFPPQPPNPTFDLPLENIDDGGSFIDLPFQVRIFDFSNNILFVAVNGWVSNERGTIGNYYTNGDLSSGFISEIGHAVFAYWDDLLVYPDRGNSIRYSVDDTSVTIRYEVGRYQDGVNTIAFTLYYTTNTPGKWYIYYDSTMTGNGDSATIGAQGSLSYTQYEFNTPGTVTPGLRLALDTNCAGRYVVG